MNETKKINLLPQEIKNKYISRYMLYISLTTAGILILIILFQYITVLMLNFEIRKIQKENDDYNAEKENIALLEQSIEGSKQIFDAYNTEYFPMAQFMSDLEDNRPDGVFIISIDTPDRLVNEGKQEDEEKEEESTERPDKEKDAEGEKSENRENETEITKEYVRDICEQTITVRGYGENQDDISNFIYALSKLPYISHTKITAIEEHKIEDGIYNIFEVKLQGGRKNEINTAG